MKKLFWAGSLMAVIAGGIYFRGDMLQTKPFWGDEQLTRGFMRVTPFGTTFLKGCTGSVSPAPLDYLFLYGWIAAGVDLETNQLRYPSFVYGVLLLLVAWLAARRLYPDAPTFAWAAMIFLSLDVVLTYYSQEARPYSLWALLTGVQLYLFCMIARDPALAFSRQWILWLTVINTLILQTATGAVFHVVLTSAAAFAWAWQSRRDLVSTRWGLGAAATVIIPVVLASAWIYYSSRIYYPAEYWKGSFWNDVLLCIRVIYGTVGGGHKLANVIRWSCALGGIWLVLRMGRPFFQDRSGLIALLFLATLGSSIFVSAAGMQHHYMVCQRQLISVTPFACFAAALPAAWAGRPRMVMVPIVLMWAGFNLASLLRGWRL
jgi:hypothetical protein